MPVTVVGDRPGILGFQPNKILEALGRGQRVAVRDPASLLPLLTRVLQAVERAVREMPAERIDWSSPDRNRTMRQFTFHIFRRIENYMAGTWRGGSMELPEEDRHIQSSFQSIADYGHRITEQYQAWAASQDPVRFRRTDVKDVDGRTPAERLDTIVGHSIQHLRQIYMLQEQFGVTPSDRMRDSEFPPEHVLTILW